MKIINKTLLALSGLGAAFGLVASLSTPVDTAGYSFIGGSLGLGQRDFRVWNNFTDASANNNTTPNPDFPSATGAVQAMLTLPGAATSLGIASLGSTSLALSAPLPPPPQATSWTIRNAAMSVFLHPD